jgi:3-dehydroquinate dehydratase-2
MALDYLCPVRIAIVNGPNLNLLGTREPSVYGHRSFEDYLLELREAFPELELVYFQSNIEGELIDFLQQFSGEGIVLNAGGYSHTSVAIADCVKAISVPVVSVHISNIYAREEVRHHDLLAAYSLGQISGLGLTGYELAVRRLLQA